MPGRAEFRGSWLRQNAQRFLRTLCQAARYAEVAEAGIASPSRHYVAATARYLGVSLTTFWLSSVRRF